MVISAVVLVVLTCFIYLFIYLLVFDAQPTGTVTSKGETHFKTNNLK